jgi:hypothetical protein
MPGAFCKSFGKTPGLHRLTPNDVERRAINRIRVAREVTLVS